jgi:nucleoside-diphosphate-sugar epimerase
VKGGQVRVLVVGGSGPTGPLIVAGLRERGSEITLFHRGIHELPELADLEHLHGDPFDADSIAATLGDRRFDLVLATYGRTRLIARAVAGRCERLVTISGTAAYAGYLSGSDGGTPLATPVREDDRLVDREPQGLPYPAHLVRRTEEEVLRGHADGAYAATILRYPTLYGPRVPHQWEWLIVRRVLDRRPFVMLPDGGLSIHSRASIWNAAAGVLAAVDAGAAAGGRIYNVVDDRQYTLRQWVGTICDVLDADLEILSIPGDVPSPAWSLLPFGYGRVAPHVIVDGARAAAELGHRDAVAPLDGIARTVRWCVEHQDEISTDQLTDPFDYAEEDRLAAEYRDAIARLTQAGERFATTAEYGTPQSGGGRA